MRPDGSTSRVKERIYLGSCSSVTKRQAQAAASAAMGTVNNEKTIVTAQIMFGELLDVYERDYLRKPENLSFGTKNKYSSHIKVHIRPAFGHLRIAEVSTKLIDDWMTTKISNGSPWGTRNSLRNLLSGIFSVAVKWGYCEKNPVTHVSAGRRKAARQTKKLTDHEFQQLVNSLPDDVRLICRMAHSSTLRISEVLGIQWKHFDFDRGTVNVEQRLHRGDLAETKTRKSTRTRPLGALAGELRQLYPGPGHEEDFVFGVQTSRGYCRDDRGINRYYLRPAAKKLGLYYTGFGFHAFRRESVTVISEEAGIAQAMVAAGHTKADMNQEYVLADFEIQSRAVEALQARYPLLYGSPKSVEVETGNGPQWASDPKMSVRYWKA